MIFETEAQIRTIQALSTQHANSISVRSHDLVPGALVVTYESCYGPYCDVVAQYAIHPGGAYILSDAPIPEAWAE